MTADKPRGGIVRWSARVPVRIIPDGKFYSCSYDHRLSNLFPGSGVK
jgi:hypothetical protein